MDDGARSTIVLLAPPTSVLQHELGLWAQFKTPSGLSGRFVKVGGDGLLFSLSDGRRSVNLYSGVFVPPPTTYGESVSQEVEIVREAAHLRSYC